MRRYDDAHIQRRYMALASPVTDGLDKIPVHAKPAVLPGILPDLLPLRFRLGEFFWRIRHFEINLQGWLPPRR